MSAIYNLHKRHGQFSGFQDLIFDLKMLRFSESLIVTWQKFPYFLGLERIFFLRPNKQNLYFLFKILNFF